MIYRRAPSPLADGQLVLYAPDETETALAAAAAGVPVERAVLAADAPPDEAEARRLQGRLRQHWAGRARRALGRALFWVPAGPALSLLWANLAAPLSVVLFWLPPLQAVIATLGASSGGPLLAFAVVLAPWCWAWVQAAVDLRRWRYARRLAATAAGRRMREAPLRLEVDPALAAFSAAAEPLRARLRAAAAAIGERGADGAGEAADLARQLSLSAARHGLGDVAAVYHALYDRFGSSERRLARAERGGAGVMAERRAGGEARRVQREARRVLDRFRSGSGSAASAFAPALGAALGVALLIVTVAGTGIYGVDENEALFLEPFGQRVTRAARVAGGPAPDPAPVVIPGPARGWAEPYPLSGRRTVSLEPRPLVLSARFRATSPNRMDVIQVLIVVRIVDLERWARLDADGNGSARLTLGLSSELDEYIQARRQEAAQIVVAQAPQLADSHEQVVARADQLVEQQLNVLTSAFVTNVARQVATEVGVQVATESQARIRRGVTADEANALVGE